MAWIRVDDVMPIGPKVKRAALILSSQRSGNAMRRARGRVLGVWLDVMGYCNRHETDGFISDRDIADLADADPVIVLRAMAKGDATLGAMVERDAKRRGWVVRNYADYQPTKAQLEKDRADNAARQQRFRDRLRTTREAQTSDAGSMGNNDNVTPLLMRDISVSNGAPTDRPDRPSRPQEQDQEQARKPRRFPQPVENFALVLKLAHGVIDKGVPVSERKDALKDACVSAGVSYDADVIRKALDSVEHRRAVSA